MFAVNPIELLMNQLQGKNPQAFQFINQAMRNGGNPQAILNQIVGNASPEQRQNLIKNAKSFGIPENYLTQIQNMKQNKKDKS